MSGSIETNSGRKSGTIGAKVGGPTISASDPTITTNATLGTQWANSTSGEFYILTDATTDKNVWTNVGAGSGDIFSLQGSSFGFTSGGTSPISNVIQKYSYSSDGNATDHGDLTVARSDAGGHSSANHGYTSGGDSSGMSDVIDKFAFASSENASDVGNLTQTRDSVASHSSGEYGYTSAGGTSPFYNIIDRFSFSSDGNATDVADLTVARQRMGATTSTTHGYTTGGRDVGGNPLNVIDKFNHTTDADATDVGDLTANLIGPTGQQY